MKVVVLGAGVVGTAAAWYLSKDGHDVTVLERHEDVARGTSQSNAGLVSPGDSTAWASPAALTTFIKSLFRSDLGIKVRFSLDPQFISWCLRFLMQCTQSRAHANTEVKLRLAFYARECINALQQETGISYDDRRKGILYFYRSQQSMDAGAKHMQYIADRGLAIEVVDRERLVALEPGLAAVKHQLVGGVYSSMDQTGDSSLFTCSLAEQARVRHGVDFRFNTVVTGLDVQGNRVGAVLTDKGPVACDAVVLSLGPESSLLARKIGIDVPVYPVKGYTATLPIDADKGPTMGGVDEDRLIAYSRLGNRLRLASTAEFAGYDRSFKPADFKAMFRTAHDLFPGAIDETKAVLWSGLRPMMPGSVPVHGQARYENLFLNTGHGHVGWTMACGSGKLVSDLVSGRRPDIDTAGLLYRN
ncbi:MULTISPECIES: D-amino acid dehydrogenase [unclassified Shinella]|uniref:D-amino acid dehydrogenase n=1 Tax=unclassified Shinella TaxID=2643062 RepID=UPI00234E5FA9|nr:MULTISPECIES: D-amino acid dehydrogenase [unclassified Shinella]MCO5153545.1 D-amino acid dehydrogenase [Shinella sp.]MDC7265782.1 D-amino acid dehydrogenase [Shinella sp. HY16]MDC7272679.1 D-amino acid dehydrogenase [Shinella sp. YZ44]